MISTRLWQKWIEWAYEDYTSATMDDFGQDVSQFYGNIWTRLGLYQLRKKKLRQHIVWYHITLQSWFNMYNESEVFKTNHSVCTCKVEVKECVVNECGSRIFCLSKKVRIDMQLRVCLSEAGKNIDNNESDCNVVDTMFARWKQRGAYIHTYKTNI